MVKNLEKAEMLHYCDRKYLLLASLMLIALPYFGQSSSHLDKKQFFEADKAFEESDYLTAMTIYEKLYLQDSTNSEVNYKLGVCKFELKNFRNKAKKNFDKVVRKDYPETNYYLGLLNHSLGKFDIARECFTQYQNYKGEKEHTNKEINDLAIKCYNAEYLESTSNNFIEIENLGSKINTEYPEYAPLIPADEKFMLFTSRRKNNVWPQKDINGEYYEDIYMSEKKNNAWQTPVMLDTVINTAVHDACTGLSANGEKMLMYRTSKDLKSGDIYSSDFVNGKWSKPSILSTTVNSQDYLESSACYSADGNIIFFSSNRPGGYGGMDLYMARKLDNGKWGEPFNLGPNINTEYNEDAPFIDPEGSTLYFSSQGHKNMGGYDVFKSTFNEAGVFTESENLGCPINTVNDDIFFVINTDGSVGYLSSEREGGFGSQDIYSVYFGDNVKQLQAFDIHVHDDADVLINKVEITLLDTHTKKETGYYKSNWDTGKILIISNPRQKYNVMIEAKGYKTKIIEDYSFNAGNDLIFKLSTANQ